MDIGYLSTMVGLLIALSIASERLVEIVKGFIPPLNTKQTDAKTEDQRKSYIQLLAVVA